MSAVDKIAIGCGLVFLFFLLLLAGGLFIWWPEFTAFGMQSDLVEYRSAVLHTNLDEGTRKQFAADFDAVRNSIDRQNNFRFFHWVEVDKSIEGILSDGEVDAIELASLKAEIARMKSIQGLPENGAAGPFTDK